MAKDSLDAVAITTRSGELYCVIYDSRTKLDAERAFCRWASNADLGFSWLDAGRAIAEIRTSKRAQVIG